MAARLEGTPAGFDRLPEVVAHADWSLHPKGRWVARAVLQPDGSYRAAPPEPVGSLQSFLNRQAALAGVDGTSFLGFDFPFGLPGAYAERAGIASFPGFLRELRDGCWPDFFRVAEEPGEVSPRRPFYPDRPKPKGEIKQQHLLDGLGLPDRDALHRLCDRATANRPAAAPMFWTMGAQQVGKAMIAGWRDLFLPALASDLRVRLWPFDGILAELLAEPGPVLAETYPGEIYHHLGIAWPKGGKRSQEARQACASALFQQSDALGLFLDLNYRSLIRDGFGAAPSGEDPFDATVGLFGMINVLRGNRRPGDPTDPTVRRVEGWILGQSMVDEA